MKKRSQLKLLKKCQITKINLLNLNIKHLKTNKKRFLLLKKTLLMAIY